MCVQYFLQTTDIELKEILDSGGYEIPPFEFSKRIFPHYEAPILRSVEGKASLNFSRYSLIPNWSKEEKPKFATYNARIETIDQKPTWKHSFINQHCIVPMTCFFEAVRDGEMSGHMVKFEPVNSETLFVAGVYNDWLNKKTGEVISSFAIITTEPDAYISKIGHDRQPLFLNIKKAKKWLTLEGERREGQKQFLLESLSPPLLVASSDRPLKS